MGILDDLPKIVKDATGDLLFKDASLTPTASRVSDGRGGYTETPGAAVTVKALVTNYSDFVRAAGNIGEDERKVIILGHDIDPPEPGNIVELEGETWKLVDAVRDPAKATYKCRAKRIEVDE